MKIYKLNAKKEWKLKKEIDLENYTYCQYGGSSGIDLFHKKGGRKLSLSTEETYDMIIDEWNKYKDSNTFYNPKDKKGNKLRDSKGKLLRIYTKDEVKDDNKIAYKLSYISYDDFHYIINNIDQKV